MFFRYIFINYLYYLYACNKLIVYYYIFDFLTRIFLNKRRFIILLLLKDFFFKTFIFKFFIFISRLKTLFEILFKLLLKKYLFRFRRFYLIII